jgi:hypothetical protein
MGKKVPEKRKSGITPNRKRALNPFVSRWVAE